MDLTIVIVLVVLVIFVLFFSSKKGITNKVLNQSLEMTKKFQDENADTLKEVSKKYAEINSEGVKITANAIKEGLATETKKCKDCGAEIPVDSDFCNKCGKQQ